MRCHICNAVLSEPEIQWNKDHKDWDPCTTCQDVIESVFNDNSEDEIERELAFEHGDTERVEDET
jgi:uncharacterized protein with PIN domain